MYKMLDPSKVSRQKKEKFLVSLTEDDFRDQVLRPVLLKIGLTDGRELHGPAEEGKDCLFVHETALVCSST